MRQVQYIALLFGVFAAEDRSRPFIRFTVERTCTSAGEIARLLLPRKEDTVRLPQKYGLSCMQVHWACVTIKM
jgi:hypothetical protein